MKKIFFVVNVIIAAGFISSCNNREENTSNPEVAIVDSATISSKESEQREFITIPYPDEMFSFIKQIGSDGKSTTHLNNVENYKKYVDNKSRALNFGIYATDFLYCSTFDYNIEALKYFATVKKLGDDLGISGVINESVAERIKKNVGKSDSLTDISNAVYFSAISELEKSDKASTLALVIAGGWIESMNLVTNMLKTYKADNPAIVRIAEQKYTLSNLIGYLEKYQGDPNVVEVMMQLKELNELYDGLKEEKIKSSLTTKNGKKILTGGVNISITEDQYKAICEKIKTIHDGFVSGK